MSAHHLALPLRSKLHPRPQSFFREGQRGGESGELREQAIELAPFCRGGRLSRFGGGSVNRAADAVSRLGPVAIRGNYFVMASLGTVVLHADHLLGAIQKLVSRCIGGARDSRQRSDILEAAAPIRFSPAETVIGQDAVPILRPNAHQQVGRPIGRRGGLRRGIGGGQFEQVVEDERLRGDDQIFVDAGDKESKAETEELPGETADGVSPSAGRR